MKKENPSVFMIFIPMPGGFKQGERKDNKPQPIKHMQLVRQKKYFLSLHFVTNL